MEKSTTYQTRLLTFASMLSLLLGASCSSPKISQVQQQVIESSATHASAENMEQPHQIAIATDQMADEVLLEAQLLASTSTNANTVAAAATRPATSTNAVLPPSREVNEAIAHAKTHANTRNNKAINKNQNLTKNLSFPVKVMLKSIAKKAQKMEKKRGENKAQAVNNSTYLIIGLILAVAGLALIIAGNTTLLYILGAAAALTGLIFLLLALL